MSDADTIRNLRAFVRDLRAARACVLSIGAKYHLLESGSVIDTLTGYLDGDDEAGWQKECTNMAATMTLDVRAGANVCLGGVGYRLKEKV